MLPPEELKRSMTVSEDWKNFISNVMLGNTPMRRKRNAWEQNYQKTSKFIQLDLIEFSLAVAVVTLVVRTSGQ
jgi:hypothetical protein